MNTQDVATQRQRLEQGRARHAYLSAEIASKGGEKKEYKAYTQKVPMLIKTNGLGATLAFMNTKGKAYIAIKNNINDWLKEDLKFSAIIAKLEGHDIVDKVIHCDSATYRALTIEVLAYLNWLKRFACGLIKD